MNKHSLHSQESNEREMKLPFPWYSKNWCLIIALHVYKHSYCLTISLTPCHSFIIMQNVYGSQPFLLKFSEIHSNEFVLIKVVLETKNYLIDISRLLLQGACNKTLCWLCNKEWILMGQSLRIKTRIPWMTITSQAVYNVVKMYIFASRIPPRTQAVNETYFTTVC